MSSPTYPRLDSGWGFVKDLLVPRVGAFATQVTNVGHIFSDSQGRLVGDL